MAKKNITITVETKKGPVNWKLLEKHKQAIKTFKEKNGTERAIKNCQGLLGLQWGEYGKNEPRIRRFLTKL